MARFNHYDALRLFVVVARHQSFSDAAQELHLTKGAVSQQVKRLEEDLGFIVFDRHPRGIKLSDKGRELLATAERSFELIEDAVTALRRTTDHTLTIGVTTYFASRWLSPRLTEFMQRYPDIRLRIQPLIDPMNFAGEEVDVAIRWGNGIWSDCKVKKLYDCPAWPTGNPAALRQVEKLGIEKSFAGFTLLRDRDDSNAWSEWYAVAGLQQPKKPDTLIIVDPSVRVQAVLDGQGIALNDALIVDEIKSGRMCRLSDVELTDYGYYFAYNESALGNPAVNKFMDWMLELPT